MSVDRHNGKRHLSESELGIEEGSETTPITPKEKVQQLGIESAIVDADNTLFDTYGLYTQKIKAYCKGLSELTGRVTSEQIEGTMNNLWNEEGMHEAFNVDPLSLREMARLAALTHNIPYYDEKAQKHLSELMSVYHTAPEPLPGVVDSLTMLRDSGLRLIVATHSSPEWAAQKFTDNGILGFGIEIVTEDVKRRKDKDIFIRAMQTAEVDPDQVIAVGDSWTSDIESAINAGIPKNRLVRVKTAYELSNTQGIEGVMEIDSIALLKEAILRMEK